MVDDDAFGEFAFSSFSPNPRTKLDSQSNGLNSLADDDDEWGDFVKSPQQSQAFDSPFDSFVGIAHDLGSPVGWVKPIGALPLSIFGDADVEEEKDLADFDRERSNAIAGDLNSNSTENGLPKSKNFSIAELYGRTSPIKAENGPASDSPVRFDWMEKDSIPAQNGFHSISDLNVVKSDSSLHKNSDFDGVAGINHLSQLIKNDNGESGVKSNLSESSQNADLFSGWTLDFQEVSSNLNAVNPDVKTLSSSMNMIVGKPELNVPAPDDDSDDGWEFQDAYSESRTTDLSNKVDSTASAVPAKCSNSSGNLNGSNDALNLFDSANDSLDLFAKPTESVDLFATSTGISHRSQEVDLESIQPSKESSYAFISETNSKAEQNNIQGTQNHPSIYVASTEFDEHFGEFTAASAETIPKTGEKDMNLNDQRSAIPLSLFEDEEPESDLPLDAQDAFMHRSFSGSDNHSYPPSISIKDLISNLYSEAETTSSSNTTQKLATVQSNLSNSGSSSSAVNGTDDLDDAPWDFKDAFSQSRVKNEASLYSLGDTCTSTSSKLNLDNYLDFYSKLKKELCFVSKLQIENLKSQGDAALSGEDANVASLKCEFQMVFKELEQMDYHSEEHDKQDYYSSADGYFSEFAENLRKPHFQILESEYHLLQKLMLAKKDLKSTMELIRHASIMLKIFKLGTSEEQTTYMSTWFDILSVCIQELKDGALIWTQTAEKHVRNELLAETQGRNFVLALGEIYRVVVILGASAKLFKPWTISGSVDSSSIFTLLEECHVLWSTSGLEEALFSVSVSTASDDTPLLNSIKDIHGLDAHTLQNYVFTEKAYICRISMLSPRVAPGMKMIKWEEDQYFVTLANLWANLMTSDPPKLPRLHIGW